MTQVKVLYERSGAAERKRDSLQRRRPKAKANAIPTREKS